ncbi:aminotransferase class V-fold PLP-dependent enzyme [Nonomuraea aridisoli]|uniref:Ergothioneine biosynthesis PLP-dependent enzyme EgtE n=1 Tax=Nonomuraea aridisoli TaxID=2070368 RepID=A0A2W2E533_9ACTN|nr:aminotransferase class V-fold PLP-dependent enzyme [Nonomuraea aridisoli]PZG08660.1 ergothioneine biosynthesis PLP-dependent enzyme EgtE [Nonomuraea aridisoli]
MTVRNPPARTREPAPADVGAAWRAARGVMPAGHLDAAGCNVPSDRVLDAVVAQLRRERERGGYTAVPDLADGRAALAALVDAAPADVAFLESGTAAMAALLGGWRLAPGSRVGHARTEYGGTVMLLRRLAARNGWHLLDLPVDGDGRIAPEALHPDLDLVVVSHIGSHSGVVQPAGEIGALCRASGIPLVLDVCQSLGHVDVSGTRATAYVGTSRKWLAGPRGVGFLVVPGPTPAMDAATPTLGGHHWADAAPAADGVIPVPGAARYETSEGAIAARAGLGVAAREHHALGPHAVHAHLAGLGRLARGLLDGAGGWRVAEPLDEPSALVTLRPPPGDTPVRAAARAAEASLLVSVVPHARAPLHLRGPVLRVSPPPGTPEETFHRLARVLAAS